jgi:hypothetical protein
MIENRTRKYEKKLDKRNSHISSTPVAAEEEA